MSLRVVKLKVCAMQVSVHDHWLLRTSFILVEVLDLVIILSLAFLGFVGYIVDGDRVG